MVDLLIARSGRVVVDVALTVTQSLLAFGSPSSGGLAWPAAPRPGNEAPVHAWLLTGPAAVAWVIRVRVGRAEPTASPPVLGCSQTRLGLLKTQTQPVPLADTKLSPGNRLSTTRSGPVALRGPLLATTMVEVMFEPSATGLGVLVLDKRRSAPSRSTATVAEPLLLLLMGSGVALLMVAVLVKLAPAAATAASAGAVATMVMSSVAPTARLARVQLTLWPVAAQAQFGPAADTNVQPAGSGSVTTALTAATGPLLRGSMRKLTGWPAVAGWAEVTTFWAMRRSAPATTLTAATAVLSAVSGSATPPAAGARVALLVTVPPAALTVPTSVTGGMAAPTAWLPLRLHVTTPEAWLQVQPLPVAETKLTDGGRLSVMTIAPPAFGPALLAVSR